MPNSLPVPERTCVPLDGPWELARVQADEIQTPEQCADINASWRSAIVPGTVAETLRQTGEWSWESPSELDAWDWWYRCEFSRAQLGELGESLGQPVALVFDGLATIADVWLNGTHILRSENMFCAHSIDVASLVAEQNTLYIRFASLKAELAKRRPRPAWRTKLVDQQQLRWIRTTLLGRMPGWSSGPQGVGPWRGVRLEASRVRHRDVRSRMAGAGGAVDIDLRVRGSVESATGIIDGSRQTLVCEHTGNETRIRGSLHLDVVERWWPHTHGQQRQYPVVIELQIDGCAYTIDCGKVAFRSISLDTREGNFAFRVNDLPIFCRGACWSTTDVITLGGTHEQYRRTLELARDAGMNMLRVGGTMIYEDQVFYDLCDELGILVWQDFMFANMDYPFTDETFARNVREESIQFLQRTQRHACIALWCGNSEIEQQTSMLGLPKEQWSNEFFQRTLPALCTEFRPDVPYWPSSPSGGTFPFHVDAGDAHYFGYGPYLRSYDDVRTSGVKFASETLAFAHIPDLPTIDLVPGGLNGAGHHPAWKAAVARDNGANWDFEDVRDHYLGALFNVRPAELRYGDIERYVELGRVTSGEVIGRAFSYWRQPNSGCHGALLWFYRDLRPGAGWGIVDSTGRPKAAYYATRRVSRPVAVFLGDEGLNGLTITVINETASAVDGQLTISLFKHGELSIGERQLAVHLPARTTQELRADALFEGFRDLSYAYRFGPPNHDLVVATLTDTHTERHLSDAFFFPTGLPASRELDLGLSAEARPLENGCYELKIQTRRFAQSVTIDVGHFWPDDNYFHVAPNSYKIVILRPISGSRTSEISSRRLSGMITALNSYVSARISLS